MLTPLALSSQPSHGWFDLHGNKLWNSSDTRDSKGNDLDIPQAFLSPPRKPSIKTGQKTIFYPGINHHFRVSITNLCLEKPRKVDQSWGAGKILNFYRSRRPLKIWFKKLQILFLPILIKCEYHDLHIFLGGSLTLPELIHPLFPKILLWLNNNMCCVYVYVHFSQHQKKMLLPLVTRSCLILCDTMDCSPPGSSVHGIF